MGRLVVLISLSLISSGVMASELTAGRIASRTDVSIAPAISGLVRSVHVRLGASVKPGDTLIKLDCQASAAQSLIATRTLAYSQAEVDSKRNLYEQKSLPKHELTLATASLAIAKAELNAAKKTAELCIIKSPVYGQVVALAAQVGLYVQGGDGLLQIVDNDDLYGSLNVHSLDWQNYTMGAQFSARVTETGAPIVGTVTAKVRNIKKDKTFNLEATFDSTDGLAAGMRIEAIELVANDEQSSD